VQIKERETQGLWLYDALARLQQLLAAAATHVQRLRAAHLCIRRVVLHDVAADQRLELLQQLPHLLQGAAHGSSSQQSMAPAPDVTCGMLYAKKTIAASADAALFCQVL
jgi:hypothetical protein